MKPEYRVKMEIYDDNVGEPVSVFDQPLFEDAGDIAAQALTLYRKFLIAKEEHEATHYPKEDEEV